MMQGERRHAQSHQENHSVLVQRIPLAEDGQMEEHDGEELA